MYSRQLNTIETGMANAHAGFMGSSQVVTLVHIDQKINETECKQIFTQYCLNHPILLSKLIVNENKWYVKRNNDCHNPCFETFRMHSHLPDFDIILKKEVNDILDYSSHLTRLRIIYLQKNVGCLLILTQHHAITDTYSAKKTLSHILNFINLAKTQSSTDHLPLWHPCISSHHFQPDVEQHFSNSSDTLPLHNALYKINNPTPLAATNLQSWILNRNELKVLDHYAKKIKVSLNSLLTAIMSLAVMEHLRIRHINTYSAVSLRKLNRKLTEIGCILDIADIDIKASDIPTAAQFFEQEMHNIKSTTLQDTEKQIFVPANSQPQHINRQNAINGCEGLGFTNGGKTNSLLTQPDIHILAYRSIANRTSGSLLFTFHFSFHLETLIITAVFSELILSKEQSKLFVENANRILHSIVMSHTSLIV
ncbi:unnamed protein product [Commensalibacter communis]|uniref:hypothetical protein n=1 Tax=Commensalibacter communis TaxID=2972786 RepID=UPI0022FF90EE|nr:hypothetical protein [Commensalibacter communis]CAI3960416.1 unnamed protein product [Commensalibacter communis]CAI3961325.1 unnamed protein product [Commensalibacter communis]